MGNNIYSYLKEMGLEIVDWLYLAQDMPVNRYRSLVSTVINRIPQQDRELLEFLRVLLVPQDGL
jgi:hypothetical protein